MIRTEISTLTNLLQEIESLKSNNKTIGLCHGCFDMLHIGHLNHFFTAKKNCDILIVSVTADEYVNKGPYRPVVTEKDRATMILNQKPVDFVLINKRDGAVNLLEILKPNFFFKGIEYSKNPDEINPNFLKELEILNKNNGKMIYTDDEIRSSTTYFNKLNQNE